MDYEVLSAKPYHRSFVIKPVFAKGLLAMLRLHNGCHNAPALRDVFVKQNIYSCIVLWCITFSVLVVADDGSLRLGVFPLRAAISS